MVCFSVAKSPPELVAPSEPTPGGTLPLSFMDRNPALRVLICSTFVYREGGKEAATAIREALSKALVPYYPVAGRITDTAEDGEPEIACTGDGAWFVEATANCTLADVSYLQQPLENVAKEDLLPFPPPKVDEKDLILLLQVTKFKCGGFVIGLRSSHAVFDGVGQGEFLKAVGELARGLPQPSVAPVWGRDAFHNPPKFPRGPLPAFTPFNFEISVLDLTSDFINQVKNQYLKETGQRCSSFDVVSAKVWQCRTRVVGLTSPDDRVHLGFAVNTRHLLQDVLPAEGVYYGNCVYNMAVSAAGDVVACAPLVEVVGLIREAKRRVPSEFSKWMTDGAAVANALPLGCGTMTVLDWSRVGFFEVDYGWGQPMHGAPLVDTNFIAWCILLKPLPPNQGLRLLMRCVEKQHLAYFSSQMMSSALSRANYVLQ